MRKKINEGEGRWRNREKRVQEGKSKKGRLTKEIKKEESEGKLDKNRS